MAGNLNGILEDTKIAREKSLLGEYDSASVYYEGTIQQIHKLLTTIHDPTRKLKWQQVGQQTFNVNFSFENCSSVYRKSL